MDAVRGLRLVREGMRRLGWAVVEVPGWESRGQGSVIVPKGEVNHWTAGAATGATPSLSVVTHGRAGLRNALCHTYSSRHDPPRLYLIAARVAWHAGAGSWPGLRGNVDCLGHEPECPGPGQWAPGQLELQTDLSRIQMDVFGYPTTRVIDHFEWTPRKIDRKDVGGPQWRTRVLATEEDDMPLTDADIARVAAAVRTELLTRAATNQDAQAGVTLGTAVSRSWRNAQAAHVLLQEHHDPAALRADIVAAVRDAIADAQPGQVDAEAIVDAIATRLAGSA